MPANSTRQGVLPHTRSLQIDKMSCARNQYNTYNLVIIKIWRMIWNANFGWLSGNDSHTYGFEKLNFATVLQLVREKSANLSTTPIKCIANCKPIFPQKSRWENKSDEESPVLTGREIWGDRHLFWLDTLGFDWEPITKFFLQTKPRKTAVLPKNYISLYSWDIKLMSEFLRAHLSPSEFKISGSVWFCWNT